MTYRIFVSHVSDDKQLAEAIKSAINDAFEGSIELYLAVHELAGGDEWKTEIRKNLNECDALISVMTPASINRPWIYIEWSAFWIEGRQFFCLMGDGVEVSHLIEPMRDLQAVKLSLVDDVRRFFRRLKEYSGFREVPYKHVDDFVDKVALAQRIQAQERAEKTYEKYRARPRDLPAQDAERHKIAEYFYDNDEKDIFQEIVREIRDDHIKADIAIDMLSRGDMEQVDTCTSLINDADQLEAVGEEFIKRGLLDAPPLRKIVEAISERNNAALRKLCVRLAEMSSEESHIFRYALDLFTNRAELRKVASFFIANHRHESDAFESIYEQISEGNVAELRKLASEMLLQGLQRTKQYEDMVELTANRNNREAQKILEELASQDPTLFKELMGKGYITNTAVLARLKKVLESLD